MTDNVRWRLNGKQIEGLSSLLIDDDNRRQLPYAIIIHNTSDNREVTPCWQWYIISWHWSIASSAWKLLGYRQATISNATLNPLQPSHGLTLSSEHYKISGIGYISIVIWNDVCTQYCNWPSRDRNTYGTLYIFIKSSCLQNYLLSHVCDCPTAFPALLPCPSSPSKNLKFQSQKKAWN